MSLEHFQDRNEAIKAFDHLWDAPSPWILAYTGFSGHGKSTLLDWLEAHRCQPQNLPYALIGIGEHAHDLFEALHDFFEKPTTNLRRHLPRTALQEYQRNRASALDELNQRRMSIRQTQVMKEAEGGAQMMSANVAEAYREMERQIGPKIFDAWLDCIEALADHPRVVLLLDNYDTFQENASGQDLKRFWGVLERAYTRVPGLRVILASREAIRHQNELRVFENDLAGEPLETLALQDSDALLQALGVTDAAFRQAVYTHLAHGHPLITRMAAEAWAEAGGQLTAEQIPHLTTREKAVEWVQGRILERLSGPLKEGVRWAALLRWFHAESLNAMLKDPLSPDDFYALRQYAFIIRPRLAPEYWACHDLVRRVQTGYLQRERPDAFHAFHQKAREYLAQDRPLDALYHHFFLNQAEAFEVWKQWEGRAAFTFDHVHWGPLIEIGLAPEIHLTPERRAEVEYRAGRRHYYRAEWALADEHLAQALERFNSIGDRLGQANVLKALGDVQQFRKELDAALGSYAQALERFNSIGDRLGQANVLKAIGDVQQFRDDRDAALGSYAQALERFNSIGSVLGQANVLKAIGDVQQFRDDRDAALGSYAQALERFNSIGSVLGQANVQQSLGKLYLQQEDESQYENGLNALDNALVLYRQIGDRVGQTNVYTFFARWLAGRGQFQEALKFGNMALTLANEFIPDHPFTEWLKGFVQALETEVKKSTQ